LIEEEELMNCRNTIIGSMAAIALLASCQKEAPIYEATAEALHRGSLYYSVSEANCKSCHGTDWNGNGPEARSLKEQGLPVPDFTAPLSPDKTVLDYFKAITTGTEKTKSLPSGHAYQSHTDRARWAMANFLYSLGKPSSDEARRKAASEAAMKEVRNVYAANRRWYMGDNRPSAEREKAPALEVLLQKAGFTPSSEISIVPVSDSRREATFHAQENQEEGYILYKNNCQSCHGVFGEGSQGAVHLGALPGSGEGKGGIPRLKPVYSSIRDLADIGDLSSRALSSAHNNRDAFGQKSYALTEEQWELLADYIKSITGK
jgi:mono/diheme cytochrome c family protein